jgi:hypothetical protein
MGLKNIYHKKKKKVRVGVGEWLKVKALSLRPNTSKKL